MAKFNTHKLHQAATFSPYRTATSVPDAVTYEGGQGFTREPKTELFLLAVSNMVSENTFYESADNRDERYRLLVRELAQSDPEWTRDFLVWLRGEANMRSAAIVGACEFVIARLNVGGEVSRGIGYSRDVISRVCQRADEPGEVLAYYTSQHGRQVPKPIKRGVADAAVKLYNERSLLKYDSNASAFRFGDVLELTHPTANTTWQGSLFKHAIDRRHGREGEEYENLRIVLSRQALMEIPVDNRYAVLMNHTDPSKLLSDAGMTWESVAGWLQGPMDARVWEAVIPSMGYMALLRNLRNFDEAGVSDKVANQVIRKLADPHEVSKSRQLPMRFLSAYRTAPSLRWGYALEQALNYSLQNVPKLSGENLILVDMSASMSWGSISRKSTLSYADAAKVFGTALAVRSEQAQLVQFGNQSQPVHFRPGESVLRITERFHDMGGTNTVDAIWRNYHGQDRVIIVTDEQRFMDYGTPGSLVSSSSPVYTWNLAGYGVGHELSGEGKRHTFGGLNDGAFRMIPLLESGKNGVWPWQR